MKFVNTFRTHLTTLLKNPTVVNMITVGLITLLVKGLGFFKEMTVGRTYGLSELLDTFLIAVLIPGFMNNVFMSSFQNVFVPNYITEQKAGNRLGAFQSASLLLTIGMGLLLSIGAYLFTDVFLEYIFDGHTAAFYLLVRQQFYWMLPCILFWSLSAFFASLLEIKGKFRYSAIYPIITALVMLVLLKFFRTQLGNQTLSIGMLLGSFTEMSYLLFLIVRFNLLQLKKPNFLLPNIQMMYRQLPAKTAALLLNGMAGFVNQIFASRLLVGSIAAINYGLKIPSFICGILIIAVGNVAFPYFSKLIHEDRKKAYQIMFRTLLNVFVLTAIASAVVFFLSTPIITLLFQKGSFSANDTKIVSLIQQILLVYVPFYVSAMLIIKFLTSINKNHFMVIASVVSLVLNIVFNFWFAKLAGVNGIAMATTLVSIINFAILFLFLRYQRKKEGHR